MKHKKLFISLTAVFSVIIYLAIFLLIWFFADTYKDFKKFESEFEIPGLDDGAVPQGLATCSASYDVLGEDGKTQSKTQQYFFVSAYMVDKSPSRIYVRGDVSGYIGYVTMKTEAGEDFKGHCGGIATNGSTLWIASGKYVYSAKASEAFKSKNIAREIVEKAAARTASEKNNETEITDYSITFSASFNANCNAAYLYYYDNPKYSGITYDRLYVGEFYRKGNYETDKTHRLKTPNGYNNTAFMYEYNAASDSDNKYGLITLSDGNLNEKNKVPKIQKIFSMPEKIQGLAFSGRTGSSSNNDGLLVLSQSYGLANSHLLCFDWGKVLESSNSVTYLSVNKTSFEYNGVYKTIGSSQIPYTDSGLKIYYVDKANEQIFVKDYSIPSMSEGMCAVTKTGANDTKTERVYVLFESAGKKYNKYVREQLDSVYSFIPRAN